jgi:hypothetical protein
MDRRALLLWCAAGCGALQLGVVPGDLHHTRLRSADSDAAHELAEEARIRDELEAYASARRGKHHRKRLTPAAARRRAARGASFEDAQAMGAALGAALADCRARGTPPDAETRAILRDLVSTTSGARGWFVAMLTDPAFGDVWAEPIDAAIVDEIASRPEPNVRLAVTNRVESQPIQDTFILSVPERIFETSLSPVVENPGRKDGRSKNRGERVRFDGVREFRRVLGVPQSQWSDSTQVMNVAMSAAAAVAHDANGHEALAAASRETCDRSVALARALAERLPEVADAIAGLAKAAAVDDGAEALAAALGVGGAESGDDAWGTFLRKWNYGAEQRAAIRDAVARSGLAD